MALHPTSTPTYAQKARIIGGENLLLNSGAKMDDIAQLAGCHVNTVSDAIRGRSKIYGKAHQIFTALNIKAYNSLSRAQHVEFQEGPDFLRDSQLEGCLVFRQVGIHMRT